MTQTAVSQDIQQQASKLLSHVAGYVGLRTMDIGLRYGLIEELARHPNGMTADELAQARGLDPFYVRVWCRSAYAAEVLELGDDGQTFRLAPYVDKLLLDRDFPGYIGAMPGVMTQPEVFDHFAERLPSGERLWWDQCSPAWMD